MSLLWAPDQVARAVREVRAPPVRAAVRVLVSRVLVQVNLVLAPVNLALAPVNLDLAPVSPVLALARVLVSRVPEVRAVLVSRVPEARATPAPAVPAPVLVRAPAILVRGPVPAAMGEAMTAMTHRATSWLTPVTAASARWTCRAPSGAPASRMTRRPH